ncbi:kinase-associated protein B [Evansella vedderi]|uniref:Kinase-associated protein B n=1 Tax=Evansella vedderi TaxID=38282 RepID=A0ABT9ZWS3_9BACI|nr:kinase-associated lipoprotein B [Evansella vedderi]MDQ0255682.1 kinase-associated protein B [Evansella vedderi]
MSEHYEVGQIVTGIYKTGKYIGEITEIKPERYVVKVLAVLKHPQQGDLHQAKSAHVPFFHERRALAYREKTNIPNVYVKSYDGDIPEYKESLRIAVDEQKEALEKDGSEWAAKSLEILQSLEKDYFKS